MRAAISWITSSPLTDLNACGAKNIIYCQRFSGSVCRETVVAAVAAHRQMRTAISGQKAAVERSERLIGKLLKE